jgi:hypothetical protein
MNNSEIARTRRRDLRNAARKLRAAEIKVSKLRADLDRQLWLWAEDGTSPTQLSIDSGLSRETVYRAIRRQRNELASQNLLSLGKKA